MQRLFDILVETVDRVRSLFGLNRLTRKGRGQDLEGRGAFRRLIYFLPPVLVIAALVYVIVMIWRFEINRGEDLTYPQTAVTPPARLVPSGESVDPESGQSGASSCDRSRIVQVQAHLLDFLVNKNDWIPGTPQYTIGFFWLVDWESTPFFDDKASFQTGVLIALRRVAVEMTDTLGRVRGTSEADPDLQAARGLLQIDEQTWIFNPFDDQRPTLANSAASAYRDSIELLSRYNGRLADCAALFDARADNLFQLLDRIANDLGSTVDQLARRSQGRSYDPETDEFVNAEGNDRGWFDFRADNFFHRARGKMYAYHGLLQGARADFADVIATRDIADVWDRMEAHIAEAAVLDPLIVSNGREDGLIMPDHLSVMAENILRARANMVEIRGILDR